MVAADAPAARRGVTPGMALAEAEALAAGLVAVPWDAERLARAALEVTTALLSTSPRVSWEGTRDTNVRTHSEGVWWLDAANLGDEVKLIRRIYDTARHLDFGRVQVGLADSAIAAYAATVPRFAQFPARRTLIVPAGRDADFLAPYPLGLLDLDEDVAETCHALGLTTVGHLAALEPGEVEARFGPAGLSAHRLARGLDSRGPSAPRDDTVPAVGCDLGGAIATAEPLLFVLKGALGSLTAALRDRALAARELTIALTLDDGSLAEKTVRPARPTSHPDALFDHLRAALEDWSLPEPVTALALRATVTVPASGEQGDLLVPRWADPAAIEAAFDRIRGREGADAVAIPEARDAHLPEDAGAWRTSEAASGTARADVTRRGTPRDHSDASSRTRLRGTSSESGPLAALRLLSSPEPVRVRLGRAGLEAFRHGATWHDVAAWSGPERLTPRWWRRDTTPGARDYYTARDRDGALWLLFRRGTQWHLAGWWD